MTFEEAIEAVRVGSKVTCSYFSREEYLTLTKDGRFVFEDGYYPDKYWFDTAKDWNVDWRLYD